MENLIPARKKAISSAKRLLDLLAKIEDQQILDSEQKKALEQDQKAIRQIEQELTNVDSIEGVTDLWYCLAKLKREFGGYVGDDSGRLLMNLFENLYKDVFSLYQKVTLHY